MINQEQELFVLNENGNNKNNGGSFSKKIIIAIVLAAAAACAVLFFLLPKLSAKEQNLDLFAEGVSVLGCDLSGQDFSTGEDLVQNAARDRVSAAQVLYRFGDEEYLITGEQAGMEIHYEPALEQAFAYGKSGNSSVDSDNLKYARTSGMPFECEISVDPALIEAAVTENFPNGSGTREANRIETSSDEETKTTEYEIRQPAGENDSIEVDVQKLCAEIENAFINSSNDPITVQSNGNSDSGQIIEVINSYQVGIAHPEMDSAYNIWKASEMLNGTEIKAGETWSMLDSLGSVEEDAGWKNANELIDEKIENIPGGGLNHLASTIYAAALACELDIEKHAQRPWPADYIEPGLDADIFSENADLKIRNTSDQSIYLVIECAAAENTLTVSFLGEPFDDGLKRELDSETVEENNDEGGITVEVTLNKENAAGNTEISDKLFEVKYKARNT